MRLRTTPISWLLVLALWVPTQKLAAETDPSAARLWVGTTLLDFDYEEFDDRGDSLDREQGLLPGANGGFTYRTPDWRLDGTLRWLSGDADYTSPSAETTTDEEILDLSLFLGLPLLSSASESLHLIAGGGYHSWWRNIRSTAFANGIDETYRWPYLLLGLHGEHRLDARTDLTAAFQLQRTLNPELSVHFLRDFDDVDLDLKEKTGFRISFGLTRALGDDIALQLSPWFEYWKLGRSDDQSLTMDGVPVGTVFEPRSETHNIGIDLNLSWRFDL